MRRQKLTVFLTSHVLEVVERMCTHVGIIMAGRVAIEGSLDELRRAPDGSTRSLEELFLDTIGARRDDAGAGLDWLTSAKDGE